MDTNAINKNMEVLDISERPATNDIMSLLGVDIDS